MEKKAAKVTAAVHASGKRKRAVARATIQKGNGKVRVNSQLLELIQPELSRERIREPVVIAGDIGNNINVDVHVMGGGWSAQAEAARLAIARAMVIYTKDDDLKQRYLEYDRHLLVADTRYKEKKQPGTHSRARGKRQKSYR